MHLDGPVEEEIRNSLPEEIDITMNPSVHLDGPLAEKIDIIMIPACTWMAP